LEGPALELLPLEGGSVRFLWLIPITSQEVEFKKKPGLEAPETRFEEVQFDYLAPDRKSAV
jgi:hypothetical protein